MEPVWEKMYHAVKEVQQERELSKRISAGGVAAAVESASGNIYVGVCVDTACSLGVCAERSAMFHMITKGEHQLRRVLALMPNGKVGAPCGACREFMAQLMEGHLEDVEIMLDYKQGRIVTLKELAPDWWL